jgi:hypothetical protein
MGLTLDGAMLANVVVADSEVRAYPKPRKAPSFVQHQLYSSGSVNGYIQCQGQEVVGG